MDEADQEDVEAALQSVAEENENRDRSEGIRQVVRNLIN